MTGKGKNITPEFSVGKSKIFFPDTYINKESARAIAKRYIKSSFYSEKNVFFFTISKVFGKLIIFDNKGNRVFPKREVKNEN